MRYIEVALEDIETADKLANEVLGRTLDELPPQSRKLLQINKQWVDKQSQALKLDQKDFRFSRKDVREISGWGNTQLKVHLRRLEEMEYLLVHRGGRGQSFVYELLYNGQGNDGEAFLMGLIDTNNLQMHECDEKKSGSGNQVRRYESGKAKPSLEVLEKIALTLHVSLDWLVFGEDLRGPDDTLKLQFEAVSQFDEEDKKVAKALLESLILKHNAKRAFR